MAMFPPEYAAWVNMRYRCASPRQGYEPGNCRWATRKEQLANRRLYKGGVVFDGEAMSLKEAMKRQGIRWRSTVRYRLKHGCPIEEALGVRERFQ